MMSNFLLSEPNSSYDDGKETLKNKFAGAEYRWSLETKLHNMGFKKLTYINLCSKDFYQASSFIISMTNVVSICTSCN